ncbi:MAG: RdgB/HAM1 family non-canonical purine NTP pyrophosphatase [Firmicutes bacterium]|nr:RdgB/HAM1 family non-canonical purine NTP pyrophosphatase [Bacillota bacterium]
MTRLVIATHNPGKLREFRAILRPWADRLISLSEAAPGVPPPEERGDTYEANARLKAHAAAAATGLPALADDSGLEVDALGGEPGPRSARFAGEGASAAENNALLLERLRGVPWEARGARYVACLVLASPDGREAVAWGTCRGRILDTPRGEGGFGYDPLFYLPAFGRTFAELSPNVKNRVSHRARAARGLWLEIDAWLAT